MIIQSSFVKKPINSVKINRLLQFGVNLAEFLLRHYINTAFSHQL